MSIGPQPINVSNDKIGELSPESNIVTSKEGRSIEENKQKTQLPQCNNRMTMSMSQNNPKQRVVESNKPKIDDNETIRICGYCTYLDKTISSLTTKDIVKQGLFGKFFSFVKDCISSLTLGAVSKSETTELSKNIDLTLESIKKFSELQDNSGSIKNIETLSAAVDATITSLKNIQSKCKNDDIKAILMTANLLKNRIDKVKSQNITSNNVMPEIQNNAINTGNSEQGLAVKDGLAEATMNDPTRKQIDDVKVNNGDTVSGKDTITSQKDETIENLSNSGKKVFNPSEIKTAISNILSSINIDEFNENDKLHISNAKKGCEILTGKERNETVMRAKLNNIRSDLYNCRDATTEGSSIKKAIEQIKQYSFY